VRMDPVGMFRNEADVPQLLALDEAARCHLCHSSATAAGHAVLRELAVWWLAQAQRDAWRVGTMVEGRRRPDRLGSDGIFNVEIPGRDTPVPVFIVITQHWPKKRLPHYQLSVPFIRGLSLAAKSANLEAAVDHLIEAAGARMEPLRRDGLRNISLQRPLDAEDMELVRGVVSDLVRGLVQLAWA
jgi:hypothetical protein